jgi:hypothetical protein
LWTLALAGYTLVALATLAPGGARVKCNQQCDAAYSADVDDCWYQYSTLGCRRADPSSAGRLAQGWVGLPAGRSGCRPSYEGSYRGTTPSP